MVGDCENGTFQWALVQYQAQCFTGCNHGDVSLDIPLGNLGGKRDE